MQKNDIIAGRYRVISHLGSGGMAHVYRVEDIHDSSVYAIKEMEPTPENQNEAQLLTHLHHPRIVSYYGLFSENGFLYLVLECIEGMTLQAYLEEHGSPSEEQALAWCSQLCDALVYLHGLPKAVVYRDLKPSNIMVQPDGELRIIDFGIAGEYISALSGEEKVKALTRGYAAPEQYGAAYSEDVRTDIYSLGATLHYLLTGKSPLEPPFKFAPVRRLQKSVSYGAEAICMRCLQTNPDKRFQNANELSDALLHAGELTTELAAAAKRRTRVIVAFIATAVVALVVLFVLVRGQRLAERDGYYQLIADAQEMSHEGNFVEAEETLQKAISLDVGCEDAYIAMARLYLDEGDTSLCSQYLELNVIGRFDDIVSNEAFAELMSDLNAQKEGERE